MLLMAPESATARSILEMALAEWRKRETLNHSGTSLNKFAEFLGYSRPAVSLWLNGDNEISEDAFLRILPRLAEVLGPEIYDRLGYKRPNPLHQYIDRNFDNVPETVQRQIANLISPYTNEAPPTNEKRVKRSSAH